MVKGVTGMLAPWAVEEMQTADLNDQRLNRRLTSLLSDLGSRPTASIPAACGGYNEMTAAYRFFDNDKATTESVLQPHYDQTLLRMAEQKVVLLVQDTTELDLTRPKQQVGNAGPLDTAARRGCFLHPLHAFTPDGTPLGSVGCQFWTRDEASLAKSAEEKRRQRRAAPIEDKESWRWVEGLRQARAVAQALPQVRCVCIADSEADIDELFAEPRGEPAVDWLIRACQDRALESTAQKHVRQAALQAPVQFTQEITVRGRQAKTACETRERRQSRETRKTVVEVRAVTVTLRPPDRPDRELPPVAVNVVLVSEPNPPAGEPAVEWLLLTTLPIATVEDVRTVVQY
jgi:transposase-like protein